MEEGTLHVVVRRYLPVVVGIALFVLLLQLVPPLADDRGGPARLEPFSGPVEQVPVPTVPVGGTEVGGEPAP